MRIVTLLWCLLFCRSSNGRPLTYCKVLVDPCVASPCEGCSTSNTGQGVGTTCMAANLVNGVGYTFVVGCGNPFVAGLLSTPTGVVVPVGFRLPPGAPLDLVASDATV